MQGIIRKIRSSVSVKVALVVTLSVVLITSFYSYHHYREVRQLLFSNTEMQLLRIAEVLKGPMETLIKKRDFAGLRAVALDTAKGADIDLIALYSPKGTVVACNKEKWTGRTMREMYPEDVTDNDIAAIKKSFGGGYSLYYDSDDYQYCFAMPVAFGREGVGSMHVSLDIGTLNSEIRKRAAENFFFAVLLSILAGAAIYFLFHYIFTRRIQAVSGAAVRLAAGDMGARAEGRGPDEIGYLAASFNTLAEDITKWRTNLEDMVVQRVKDLSVLYEVVDTISKSLELSKVLPNVLDKVLENMGEQKGIILIVGKEGDTLNAMGHRGLSVETVRQIAEFGGMCVGDVILKNCPMRIPGMNEEDMIRLPEFEKENIHSALVAPISAQGMSVGAVAIYSEQKNRFTEDDEALLVTIGNQVGVAVENAKLYEKTLELAQVDGLTGLANRRHFMDTLRKEVERAGRYNTSLSVLIMDMDKFKLFNDAYGHLKGDELLKGFADLVKNNVRVTDSPGRYGGEEFAVILPNTPLKGAIVTAERIRMAMENLTVPVGEGASAGATVSIGIAELAEGETDEKILAAADAALYRAKQSGRNRVAW